ncbi:uncharacterized protein LOC132275231 [Cornus florida]|uniref:uncharacterized protein LOC132275231 n=1 Tax=Cornus florida TaxID=4283 RepID=UPI0028A1F6B5|nr:uncharacterized protein LOC132275231 [Cornus florida]XP_059632656.1 uncharacterized protein LOC132275231 [Cornus florida]
MECNKEEAIRAKEIAEKKMQNKDFVGARKIALKAQQLYSDLDNISQMIMVCDVHCSAENKVYGNEKNWYGILKIEPTADEVVIKKQYRKFALMLHPDKNKFAGAADAFKLIGEAQRVLLDREKRMLHDTKCRAFARPTPPTRGPQQANWNSNVGKQPWVQNNLKKSSSHFTHLNMQHQQPQQQAQSGSNNRRTFWTLCPFCGIRYQFYIEVLNKLLSCQTCKRSFTGYEINPHSSSQGTNMSQHLFPKNVPSQGASKVGPQRNVGDPNPTRDRSEDINSSRKMNGKRMKRVSESSESCNTESSSDSEDDTVIDEDGDPLAGQKEGYSGEQHRRRSNRSKRDISYNETLSDDDNFVISSKRAKYSGSFPDTGQEAEAPKQQDEPQTDKPAGCATDMEAAETKVKHNGSASNSGNLQNGKEETKKMNENATTEDDNHKKSSKATGESSSNEATDPEIYEYPDPDFSDFDKDRRGECFAVGQTWAIYDTLDAMPRFYARIRKVFSTGFKLRITWLEPAPDDEDEIKWVDEGLPVSCGKFNHGKSETSEDHGMFSHLIYWEKGNKRDTYKIYPRKGETWALFKKWDINWYSDPDSRRKYEFEFVEVLSEYAEDVGVSVAYLGKVKGFACLFCRTVKKGMDSFELPPSELFRFSHRVPSFQMSGDEGKNVPKGCFELDPASLPTNLEEISVPDLNVGAGSMNPNGYCSKSPAEKMEPMMECDGNASGCQVDPNQNVSNNFNGDTAAASPSNSEAYEIPEPEFYNFDAEKSPEKFQIGQLWALYSDEDGLPKYYCQVKRIDFQPEFKLHVAWLNACSLPKGMMHWRDKKMPITCGRFKVKKGTSQKYTATHPFSHQLKVEITDEKDIYVIFPRKGEVWALYKNWNAGIKCSDLDNCDYDMVEILEENDSWIEVLLLELVNGHKSVFKAQIKEGLTVTTKIPRVEQLRISHQIPAYRLTDERGGSLRGFWELDPAALPVLFFCSS